ncbi:DUF4352 domain-containing protein [Lysinibacillus fusiformis]|uniref:DUF4352 domain-containing protein n=1 Tax=Lysinibacillus fusiformis TaxID=28031 RepID=UPI00187F8A62|nr:DUF4352 domain-containing protein [Lysinibacillus fusiformis]MBD8522504.1 DUF4352 domain-containing protein [Lysinibacillus fusiformis]
MKKFLKIGCGGFIALFILLIIIGMFVGDDNKETTDKEKEPVTASTNTDSKNDKSDAGKDKKVSIGEELSVGKVIFKVNSINEVNEISAANGYMKYKPDAEGAVFLNVNVTVKNSGTEMIQTDSSFFKLKAANGASYSPSTIIVADDKYFTFEGINPGLALTGNVLFEVPTGLTGLDLQVQTGFWGTETGIIKLN